MNTAIKTLNDKLRGLKQELKIFSKPPNFSQRVIDDINIEIKQHEEALVVLNSKFE